MYRIPSTARWSLPLAVLLFMLGTIGSQRVHAAGVVGTGTAGSCTETAFDTALSGGGNVTFNCGAGIVTITLTFEKQIADDTSINGGNKIVLDGGNTNHFQVFSGKTLSLKNITLTGGSSNSAGSVENFGTTRTKKVIFSKNESTDTGGAITNQGKLVIKKTTFKNNQAVTGGGAIWNDGGNVIIRASTFKSNKATDPSGTGGAIANNAGDIQLIGSSLLKNSGNQGGAVWTAKFSTNSISNSTLNKNKGASGAGLANYGGIEITNSTISNNFATFQGGGIFHAGNLSISTSTVKGNKAVTGGGIRTFGDSTFIFRTTISGNTATGDGGGVFSSADATLVNSTLSGNSAGSISNGGGGWYQKGNTATFEFVTIANNSASFGAGINADGGSTPDSFIDLLNTALSNNTGGNCAGATLNSLGNNLSSDTFCGNLTKPTDHNNTPANIGALANNGGPTLTHLPLNGSTLINNGKNDPQYTNDQRGFPRPVGGKSDIGSVEVQ